MTHFLAEILLDQKATEIHKLKNQGKRVAMVGNGINDATTFKVFTRLFN